MTLYRGKVIDKGDIPFEESHMFQDLKKGKI